MLFTTYIIYIYKNIKYIDCLFVNRKILWRRMSSFHTLKKIIDIKPCLMLV